MLKGAVTQKLGVEPIMINSALVSCQRRKRLYWTNIPNITQPEDKEILLQDVLESGMAWTDKAYCLTASYNGAIIWNTLERKQRSMVAEPIRLGHMGKGGQDERIYSVKGKTITLSANGGGQGGKTGLYKIELPDGEYQVRKPTLIEAERAQTLPDDYTAYGIDENGKEIKIAKENRYRTCGNGWTVDVIAHIFKNTI